MEHVPRIWIIWSAESRVDDCLSETTTKVGEAGWNREGVTVVEIEDSPEGSSEQLMEPVPSSVKSKQRVDDHGEVFTPDWLVSDMLDLVQHESERIDARFLEPACGSGNFLLPVLQRKLSTVRKQYGKNDFEKRHHALLALMCVYGIELLRDNAEECRERLLQEFADFLGVAEGDLWFVAARRVLDVNIIQGDALSMTTAAGEALTFPEWAYLSKGKFQRRDFLYDNLTQRASFVGTLWQHFEEHEVFTPVRSYPPLTVEELSR